MWMQPFGVCLCQSLFKLGICDPSGINPRNHWNSCFKWLRSWSLTKLKLLILHRLIGGSSCGERRPCWLTELFNLQPQKPTSFLTQCYVWEALGQDKLKLRKGWSNGLWKSFVSQKLDRVDGETMELRVLRIMLADSCPDVGLFCDLDQKRNYAQLVLINQMDWDKTAEQMMLNLAESSHPIFRATSALERGELRSKAKGKKSIHFNGSEKTLNWFFARIYGAGSRICARKLSQRFRGIFLETPTEQRNTKILLKNSTRRKRRSSMVLCNGQLTIGYLFWQQEEDQRNGFKIAWTLTRPNTSCISEQSGGDLVDLALQKM